MIRFHVLGGLTVTDDKGAELSIGGPRQRRLMGMLLIHRNNVVSVDRLADAVFAGEPTGAASTTMRSYIARIRKAVGPGSDAEVVTRAPGYVLKVPAEALDAACFERMVSVAGSQLGLQDAPQAAATLREALALWRGDAYAEFADEEWAHAEAHRLAELRLVAHERLVEAELACGRAVELIPEIHALVSEHPLREAFRALLMTALYRAGRQADALRAFRDYRAVLVEELGVEPSPALAELERRILAHDPDLLRPEPAGLPLRGYRLGNRLGNRLGAGRDGELYAASLPGVDRDFAVRIVPQKIADDPDFVRSFEAATHRVASLEHPAIVPIHDYWREPGAAYVVTLRMDGGSLTDRLERGPLSTASVAALVDRLGGALVAAAEAGIVHGRVGSDSVLFDTAGQPWLTDFPLGQHDAAATAGDDVHDFAAMVRACLPEGTGPGAAVLGRGLATVGRPTMAELVPMLLADLTGVRPASPEPLANPYKGLRAFDESDAADFFGRDGMVDEVLARLARDDIRGRIVLVVGGSGTGKSSAVRAGLLPRLRRGDVAGSESWFITTTVPGSSPFKELAEGLRRVAVVEPTALADRLAEGPEAIDSVLRQVVPGNGQLLLVIDQLEELFTLAGEDDQRSFLLGVMHALSLPHSRLRVVATLRADFYDRPLALQPLADVVNDATVTMVPMSAAELEAAIVGPLDRIGGGVERSLVTELVSAVVDEPAALPSLQFALYELAERSPERRLETEAYHQLGGLGGAIASRAERLYSSLHERERVAVRRMFERLVVVGQEAEPTRRRAARTELSRRGADATVDAELDRWAQARLLTFDRHPQTRVPTVEVAHEALLRKWPRLQGWIEEDREAIGVLSRLREAAATWDDLGRDPGALYRGARLEVATDLAGDQVHELPDLEREFLEASTAARDHEMREEAERLAAQSRANRRLRRQRAGIVAALVVALAGGFIAVDQRGEATRERRVATARELAAASVAALADDPERSVLLALAAVEESRSGGETALPEAVEALHRAVTSSRILLSVPGVGGGLDWSPDGRVFVTEGPENSGIVDIRDAVTGYSVRSFVGHDNDVNDATFSPDSATFATAGDDGSVRVWSTPTGEELMTARHGARDRAVPVRGPSFSPDGERVAAAWPQVVRVVDVATGRVSTTSVAESPSGTSFSPGGERLAIGTFADSGSAIVDATNGALLVELRGEYAGLTDIEWSPDGRWIAGASGDNKALVWDADTGDLRFAITAHTALVWELDWSPDGSRLATASEDGTALVSEVTDEGVRTVATFSALDTAHGGGMNGLAFSPDGQRLMTGDSAITSVKIWDASPTAGGEWPSVMEGVDLADGGRALVRPTRRRNVYNVVDMETGDLVREIRLKPRDKPLGAWWIDLTDDEQLLATWGPEAITVWDTTSGERLFAVSTEGADDVPDFRWSPDGERLAVTLAFRRGASEVVVVDWTGTEVARLPEAADHFTRSLSFAGEGGLLATTRRGNQKVDPANMPVTIWDPESGEVVTRIGSSAELVTFDASGDRIATARVVEGIVDIWDASTGRRLVSLTSASRAMDLAFDDSGTKLATAHADGTIRLWDPATGLQQLVLHDGPGQVEQVMFADGGSKLVSSNSDGVTRVWALDLDDLIAIAHQRLMRGLSEAECRQYLHLDRCPESD